jgi:hypothetical protein
MADEIRTVGNGFNSSDEKIDKIITRTTSPAVEGEMEDAVFSSGAAVNFRTNGWPKTSMLFLKSNLIHSILPLVTDGSIVVFATGVLNIPGAYVTLGEIFSFIRAFKPRSNIILGAVGGT